LELLQQFHLQAVSVESKKHLIFSGDLSKFSLKCGRCGKCVSPPEFIGAILFNVPQAILHHLKMRAADDDHLKMKSPNNEPALLFQSVPVLFTSCSNYSELYESFEKSIQTMSNDYCKIVHDRCMSQKSTSGKSSFCETVKVDMGASKDKKRQRHLSSTISLLQVLFEDLGLATSLYKESADGISHVQILKPEIHLFNKANDDEDPGFLFGKGIITDFSGVKMESLKLLESCYLFVYREFNMNVLVLLEEINKMIYGSKTKSDVLNRFCIFFSNE
jgi:hypothetical protein